MKFTVTKESKSEGLAMSMGYYINPKTRKEITVEEAATLKRVKSEPNNVVVEMDGDEFPIAFKLWTKEEKDNYYRANGKGKYSGTGGTGTKSTKNSELRESCLKFESWLKCNVKGENLDIALEFLGQIMPADPEEEAKKAKIAKLKAMLAELEG